jgi:hypothetical protein
MLYELLAGALPYRASNLGEMMSALTLSEPVPIQVHLPGVDASVRAFFARALARDRSQRFASAQDMARALAAAAIETAAPPPTTMGGLPTMASGELGERSELQARGSREPARAPDRVVRPVAPELRSALPRPAAPEGRWVALSIAAVAVVAIVAGAIAFATSRDGNAAAAAAAQDRNSALLIDPIDTGLAHAIEPALPAPHAGGTHAPEALCEAACRSGCGLEGPDCVRYCLADRRTSRCLEAAGTSDCEAWSRCMIGSSCSGELPHGDASCLDTFACERSCRDNIACSCSCLGRMEPAHAIAMTRLSMCALFMCANDVACVQSRCEAPLAACKAR